MHKIKPYFSVRPWAGDYLQKFFHSELKSIGEAWLLSTLPEGESSINGVTLSHHLGKQLPYLVKVIDAKESLSVQVHPDDAWAKKLEDSKGKTECWLVLSVTPGSGVYLGLKDTVSEEEFRGCVSNNKSVETVMNFIPVSRGDFVIVPAGTIHAIGGGVTLLEAQQASGITYRLWDWGRTGRELHIEKGLKVSNFKAKPEVKRNVFESVKKGMLLDHNDFKFSLNESGGDGWFIDLRTFEVHFGHTTSSQEFIFVS